MRDEGSNPKALENKPVIYDWMQEYTRAFEILNQTRQYGMGPNPIQLSEILAYLKLYGTEDTEAFIEYMLEMDAAYFAVKARKQQMKEEQEKRKNGRPDA